MKVKYYVIILLGVLLLPLSAISQDMHFSQGFNFPLQINPAFTGNYNAQTRALVSLRNQNMSVPNTAFTGVYNTAGVSIETRMFPQLDNVNTWSVGLIAMNDYAGSGTLATNQVLVSSSYSMAMDRYGQSFLTIGASGGFTSRRLFSDDLLFESQVNQFEFDPKLPNLEPFLNGASQMTFSLNIGAMMQQQFGENSLAQFGFSIYNVNNPKELFLSSATENIYSRLNIHGGFLIKMDDYSKLYPSIIYMKQGNFQQFNVGMSYEKMLNDDVAITGGLRTRVGDAFIAILGMRYKKFSTALSYDFTTSSLSTANKSMGALELNLTYLIGDPNDSYSSDKMYCPSF